MALLIATDEAGYGPKLGPLVIVASAWWHPNNAVVEQIYANLCKPFTDGDGQEIAIDDSKRVFKRDGNGQRLLGDVCRAASRWCGLPCPKTAFANWLDAVASQDVPSILNDACFADWPQTNRHANNDLLLSDPLIKHWEQSQVRLLSLKARVLTTSVFNKQLHQGRNKADVLTETTCGLAIDTLYKVVAEQELLDESICVFSDRHGGRRFYAAPLQSVAAQRVCAEHAAVQGLPQVLHESPTLSRYRIRLEGLAVTGRDVEWSFTVGGDSFAPVALSSMIAKWIREQAMDQFNRFFQGQLPAENTLQPTAGYHVDALRFLADLEKVGLRHMIAEHQLIRDK